MFLFAAHPSVSFPTRLDAFQLFRLTPFNSAPTFASYGKIPSAGERLEPRRRVRPGAATIVALVTFTSVKEWDSAKYWAADGDKHLVPSDDEAFRWRRGDGLRRRVRGWIVGDVAPIAPTPSPKMTRALRSLFKLECTADELLVKGIDDRGGGGGGGAVGDDDEEDDDAGICADDGANDRPWH